MTDDSKPIVFLAFANEQEDRMPYLRMLPEEARRLAAHAGAGGDAGSLPA